MKITGFFSALLRFFFPAECVGCKKEDSFLCEDCVQKIQPQVHRFSTTTSHLEKIWVMEDYHTPLLEKSIKALKFSYSKELVHDMNPFFTKAFADISLPEDAVFCPVPLHFFRKNNRGFNQSFLLAKEFSKITKNPVFEILKRHRHTHPQTKLSGEKRRKNLEGAFSVETHCDASLPIVLVDDVTTTFSTLKECAKTLKKNGYKNILAVVVARSE